jgi:hypothetical protein
MHFALCVQLIFRDENPGVTWEYYIPYETLEASYRFDGANVDDLALKVKLQSVIDSEEVEERTPQQQQQQQRSQENQQDEEDASDRRSNVGNSRARQQQQQQAAPRNGE